MILTKRQPMTENWRIGLALFLIYTIWGSTYFVITFVVADIPPFIAAGARFLLAGLLLLALGNWRHEPLPTALQWRNGAMVGTLLMGVGQGGVIFAQQWVASSLAATMVATVPLWSVIFASIWDRSPSRREWLGLLLGMAGVVILNLGGELWVNAVGGLVVCIAPIGWSFGSMWSRQLDMARGMTGTASLILPAFVVVVVMSILTGEHLDAMPGWEAIAGLGFLVFFGSAIALSAYTFLLKTVPPAVATSYAYVNPVIAVFLGWTILGESLTVQTLIAAAFIITAVVIITTSRHRPEPTTKV